MAVPLAQLRRGANVLEPQIQVRAFLRNASWPESVDEQAIAVIGGYWIVDALGADHRRSNLTSLPPRHRDSSAPPAPIWVAAPSGTTRNIHGSYFRFDWTAASDSGSGLAGQQVVARYIAGLKADGTCRTNGFTADSGFRLATDRSWDSGLVAGSCYVCSIRSVDNVGNTSPAVISGYIVTEPDR